MFKQTIALILCCIMVLPLCSPAFAVSNDSTQTDASSRSMEEILSDYHIKSRQIESQSNANPYSRSAQTTDTVRQDAVSELQAAGYEAYDVNADTYTSVEATLNTNLSEIGLDPESSYIIVISGEDADTNPNSESGSSRVITLPPHEYEGGDSSFTYTYDGVTYSMRYLTVTSADNPNYSVSGEHDFTPAYMSSFLDRFFLHLSVSSLISLQSSPCQVFIHCWGWMNPVNFSTEPQPWNWKQWHLGHFVTYRFGAIAERYGKHPKHPAMSMLAPGLAALFIMPKQTLRNLKMAHGHH